ncbi:MULTISPECIES: peptide deformylase [unclassified Wenzhouxiangella]|uniref:peptide deformylase n=1 Tax=unclassified Wenzhouxiangella TaxID=2613841 RepID=UPI000E32893A|nr:MULTISPECIES: peptide deformylase [unclassified Wenzhouxiangella]RFF27162.1 peptide deformylase [Wenzhouxiangella sp. 15181]RFP69152.1 peptide deformylase [Wenzhouxiangella sp. 15190]
MSKLKILEYPDPRLRRVARPVESVGERERKLAEDMLETMYDARGIGLAATQVDEDIRVVVMDLSEDRDEPQVFINPEITDRSGSQSCEEGCLSVPGFYAEVTRPENVSVRALDIDGKPYEVDADGLLAVCIQHEIDHLDGKMFIDYLSPLKRRMIGKKLRKQQSSREKVTA